MTESERIPQVPQDVLSFRNDRFSGYACFYTYNDGVFNPISIVFNTVKTTPLNPFHYNKPTPNPDDPTNPPIQFKMDEKPREGNYVIGFAKNVRRFPNHLYESDEFMITAVEVELPDGNKEWQTRVYPKNCLSETTWQEAHTLCNTSAST
jgi:hypothetical protein